LDFGHFEMIWEKCPHQLEFTLNYSHKHPFPYNKKNELTSCSSIRGDHINTCNVKLPEEGVTIPGYDTPYTHE